MKTEEEIRQRIDERLQSKTKFQSKEAKAEFTGAEIMAMLINELLWVLGESR